MTEAVAARGITNFWWTGDGLLARFDAHQVNGEPITVMAASMAAFGDVDGHCIISFSGGAQIQILESAAELRAMMRR
jgi:hypothetical protein